MSGTGFVPAVRLVVGLVRPHPVPFSISVFGAAVYAAGTVAATIVLGRIVDRVVLPVLDGDEALSGSAVIGWAGLLLVVAVLRIAGVIARRYFAGMTSERASRHYRQQLARSYVDLPMSFHRRRAPGDLIAHVDADTEVAVDVLHPVPFSLAVVMMGVFAAISMLLVDPLLALVAFAVFPLLILFNRIYTLRIEEPSILQQEGIGRVTTVAHESLDGALVVKLLGRERAESERFAREAAELRGHRIQVGRLRAVFESMLDALPNLGIAAVIVIGAWRVDQGAATVGGLVQVASLFAVLAFPMRVLGFFLESVPTSLAAKSRLESVLDQPLPTRAAGSRPTTSAALEVSGLRVGYEHTDTDADASSPTVIDDVSFRVGDGEVVALVGATGSGKSTIVSVLAGLLDPLEGSITLGGVDLAELDPADRADLVRIAFQESFLFADSVTANVALDRAGVDGDEIDRVLAVARADGFVHDLPDGPMTVVGERGMTLSGGQRQRLALARAFVGTPRLVVLDDATSAVDAAIESEILEALRSNRGADDAVVAPPAMLVVAHRLSTIRLADRVVFLRHGRVAGRGTHTELLADPHYLALATAYEQTEREA